MFAMTMTSHVNGITGLSVVDRSTSLIAVRSGTSLDASFVYGHVGQVGRVETARWAVGGLFALVGILWIISSVVGTVNYLFLGFGIVWLLGSVCWPLGILTHRRRQRAAAEKGQGQ